MKFTEILDQYHIKYETGGSHRHVGYGWIGTDCPFCGLGSNSFHMGYNLAGKFTTCWRCGYHSLYEVIEALTKETPRACSALLQGLGRVVTAKTAGRGHLCLPKGIAALGPSHRKYLSKRGFNPDEISAIWGAKGIGIAASLGWRIFIPINRNNQTVSWTTRSISENAASRYITAKPEQESIPAKSLLYGIDYAQHTIIICEGPLDVWRIGPGAVATLGIVYSKKQLVLASKFSRRYVCFDQEKEAQKRAGKLCDELSLYQGETFNVSIDAKDPGSANERELRKLRKLFR